MIVLKTSAHIARYVRASFAHEDNVRRITCVLKVDYIRRDCLERYKGGIPSCLQQCHFEWEKGY
jgi:hypothetical protein